MTREELAVVQAAMAYREKLLATPRALDALANTFNPLTPALSEIARATHALAVARSGDVHTGDGDEAERHLAALLLETGRDWTSHAMWLDGSQVRITHMADGTVRVMRADGEVIGDFEISASARALPPPGPGDDEPAAEPELIWVPRTWVDVRAGDRVRMPGTDATAHVQSAVHLRWHVKPGTGTSAYNPPRSLEWAGVRVMLETPGMRDPSSYEMDPAKPVEIEIDRETAETAALIHGGPGWWADRIGMVIEEKTA